MRCLVKELDKDPMVREIPNDLGILQKIVGGYIEYLPNADKKAAVIFDEEGKLKGCPVNITWGPYTLCGTIIITGFNGTDFCSISDLLLKFYKNNFSLRH